MIIVVHGPKNNKKAITNVSEVNELDNFSVNGFSIPQWVTSQEELTKHIEILEALKPKISIK